MARGVGGDGKWRRCSRERRRASLISAVKPCPILPLSHRARDTTLVVRHPHYPDCNTLVKLPSQRRWGHSRLRCSSHHLRHRLQQLEHRLVRSLTQPTAATCAREACPLVATDGDIYFVSHCICQSQPQSICYGRAPLTSHFLQSNTPCTSRGVTGASWNRRRPPLRLLHPPYRSPTAVTPHRRLYGGP